MNMELKNVEIMHASSHMLGIDFNLFCFLWSKASDTDELANWMEKLGKTEPRQWTPETLILFLKED